MTRVALDSNILAYLAGVSRSAEDEAKITRIRDLIGRLGDAASLIAPAQTLGELFVVLCRAGASADDARAILLEFSEAFGTSASEMRTALAAADLVVDHKLQFWDALIVTAAAEAGCTLLLSEDMQNGFVTRGLTIVNPLGADTHPKLSALLDPSGPALSRESG
ncbi:MAG: PIN domain-containing protein [Sphingobium sp.]